MPIGWTIGLTIGAAISSYCVLANDKLKPKDLLASSVLVTSVFAFGGTIIELIVR